MHKRHILYAFYDKVQRALGCGLLPRPLYAPHQVQLLPGLGLLETLPQTARPIGLFVDGQACGIAALAKTPLSQVPALLQGCAAQHPICHLFSGDATARLASFNIVDAKGGLTPTDMVAEVQKLRQAGHRLAFVGDGVNDSAAMACCEISFGIAQGAPLAGRRYRLARHEFVALAQASNAGISRLQAQSARRRKGSAPRVRGGHDVRRQPHSFRVQCTLDLANFMDIAVQRRQLYPQGPANAIAPRTTSLSFHTCLRGHARGPRESKYPHAGRD
jgi:hypothetical protein